jgi:uncharacterized membrane protein YjdF
MTTHERDAMLRTRQAMATAIDYLDAMLYSTKDRWATRTGMNNALLRALAALESLYRLRTQQGPASQPPR